ncbi:unnamed protein product, partial [Ectocarpus sp. 13 AM-2016]
MHHDQQPQDPLTAHLVWRLESTEALLAEERASNQALSDDLLRLRAGGAAAAGGGGSSDGYDKDYDSPRPRPNSSGGTPVEGGPERGRRQGRGEERPRPPWQNVLFKRQPYADNHVPGSFLEKLVTNAYVRQPDLRLYAINTFAVTQQISAVTLFLVVFMRTQDGLISVGTMVSTTFVVSFVRWLMVDLLLLFGGYATVFLVCPKRNNAGISAVNGAAPGSLARLKGRVKHDGDDPYGRAGGSGGSGGGGVPLGNDEGASPRTAAGLADGDRLDDLSLSSVSSTLASFFLFLAILR